MIYLLLHKNITVCIFNLEGEVRSAMLHRKTVHHLPLPLKRILHYGEEFIESYEQDNIILTEEGCALIDFWLNDRTIPANRKKLKERYTNGKNALTWMLENHSCSLDDCYWTRELNDNVTWDEVKMYGCDLIEVLTQEKIASKTRHYSGVNSTLGGELEKYWFCEDSENQQSLQLCKRTSPALDILSIREIMADRIYQAIGYENYCHYQYVWDREKRIVGCFCPAFTSEELELITAYDLLEEYNYTQQDDLYELLVKLTMNYGLEEAAVREYLDIQIIVDYLITNRDRHQGNIGFLRNSDTLQIVGPAPIYDSGSSEHMEYELPIGVDDTRVNGLFLTEKECLEHVSDLHRFDIRQLPAKELIREELDKSSSMSKERKDFWETLYAEKVEYLKHRMNIFKRD